MITAFIWVCFVVGFVFVSIVMGSIVWGILWGTLTWLYREWQAGSPAPYSSPRAEVSVPAAQFERPVVCADISEPSELCPDIVEVDNSTERR